MNITETSLIKVVFFCFWRSQIKTESCTFSFQVLWLSHKEFSSLFLSDFFVFSIDATFCISICKFVNDSPQSFANCQMRQFSLNGKTHLCLLAKTEISKDTELLYDYKDKHNQSWWGDICHRFFQTLLLDFGNFQYLWI